MSQNYLTQPFVRTLSGESMPKGDGADVPSRDSLILGRIVTETLRIVVTRTCYVQPDGLWHGGSVTIDMQDEIRTGSW